MLNVLNETVVNISVNNKKNLLFQTNAKFRSELGSPASRYAPQAYDAVWAIALALRAAEESWATEEQDNVTRAKLGLSVFDYTRKDMAKEFLMQLGRLNFMGVSVSHKKLCI